MRPAPIAISHPLPLLNALHMMIIPNTPDTARRLFCLSIVLFVSTRTPHRGRRSLSLEAETLVELGDASARVDEFLLAREEGVTL